MRKWGMVLLSLSVIVLFTGCSIPFFEEEEVPKEKVVPQIRVGISNADFDEAAKLVGEYFNRMYQIPIQEYNPTVSKGEIPAGLTELIASKVIDEGANNPEIGLSYPRYVDLHGVTIVEYSPLFDDQYIYNVVPTFVGNKNNLLLFYVSFDIKARVIPTDNFESVFIYDAVENVYNKVAEEDRTRDDFIKATVKYDVLVGREGSGMKVFEVRESEYKPNAKFRNKKENNDFMKRNVYLYTGTEQQLNSIQGENIKAGLLREAEVLKQEKQLIETFLKKFALVDKTRMNLLTVNWKKSKQDFMDMMTKFSMLEQDGQVLFNIGDDYQWTFPLQAFPLQTNMLNIKTLEVVSVKQHPLYAPKNKRYFANVKISAETDGVVMGRIENYMYTYEFKLQKPNDTPFIKEVKLKEYVTSK